MSGEGQSIKKIINFKKGTPEAAIAKTENEINTLGGKVTDRINLGDTKILMCTLPANTITTFATSDHIDSVEDDGLVTTQ